MKEESTLSWKYAHFSFYVEYTWRYYRSYGTWPLKWLYNEPSKIKSSLMLLTNFKVGLQIYAAYLDGMQHCCNIYLCCTLIQNITQHLEFKKKNLEIK